MLSTHRVDLALGLALAALALWVRLLKLEVIDCSGDPLENWYFVRQWLSGFDFRQVRWTHHMARYGIHWVTFIVQVLFGANPLFYYVPQLLASVADTVLIYAVGCRLSSRAVGLLAALFFIQFRPFDMASSQLRSEIFEMGYMLGAALFLTAYVRAQDARRRMLGVVGTGLFTFLAYGSKIHCLFFVPGMLLVMWLAKRRLGDLGLLLGVLAALFAIETAALNLVSPHAHRIDVILGAHLAHDGAALNSYWDVIRRFTDHLGEPWKMVLYPFAGAALVILILRSTAGELILVALPASFLFLVTFLVFGLDPPQLFLDMHSRYLSAAVPFAFLANALVLVSSARGLAQTARARALLARVDARRAATLLAVAAFAFVAVRGWRQRRENLDHHAFFEVARLHTLLNDTYRRGLPIVSEYDQRETRAVAKPLHWTWKGFLDDDLLRVDNALPEFRPERDVVLLAKDRGFIPKTKRLTPGRVRRMLRRKADCVLVLERRHGSVVKTSTSKQGLPDRCRTP